MIRLTQLRLPVDQEHRLEATAARAARLKPEEVGEVRVVKRSLDARHKSRPCYVYTLEVYAKGESSVPEVSPPSRSEADHKAYRGRPPVIVGAGPAGLFAALVFQQQGVPCILLERGDDIRPRIVRIAQFWKHGLLDPESNVCFGEGGAGLFSDGKLMTRIRSPHIAWVLERLVHFGAPPDIRFVHNPHVGSDGLRRVLRALVASLREGGCTLRYRTKVERLELDRFRQVQGVVLSDGEIIRTEAVLLGPGHSAHALYETLHAQGVSMSARGLAMGVRVEHPQALINRIRLGTHASTLGAAEYRATYHHDDLHAYTFCMCPGGYVVSSSTEPDRVVVNGMSNRRRNTPFANAALVVPFSAEQVAGTDPLRVMRFQQGLEHAAWQSVQEMGGHHQLPAQRLTDFLEGRVSNSLPDSSPLSGVKSVDLHRVLPTFIAKSLAGALADFDRSMRGYVTKDAVLMGVESRTSAPVRLERDPNTLMSVGTPGLYPMGEGAGYAGGITSAAVDGVKAAFAVLEAEGRGR